MILYLSGTGNSRHIAEGLSTRLGESTLFMPHHPATSLQFTGKTLGIVCPVYSWGIPPIVIQYISELSKNFIETVSDLPVWIVLSCGDETAFAPEMLQNALEARGLTLTAGWSVIMPNNYVLLPGFDTDNKDVEIQKLDACKDRLDHIADCIHRHDWHHDYTRGKNQWVKSKVIFPLFKRWGVQPRKWHYTQECVGCGRCAEVCPVSNIDFSSGRPRWGGDCISCCACFHICPAHAVEYGKSTDRKHQYRTLMKTDIHKEIQKNQPKPEKTRY